MNPFLSIGIICILVLILVVVDRVKGVKPISDRSFIGWGIVFLLLILLKVFLSTKFEGNVSSGIMVLALLGSFLLGAFVAFCGKFKSRDGGIVLGRRNTLYLSGLISYVIFVALEHYLMSNLAENTKEFVTNVMILIFYISLMSGLYWKFKKAKAS